MGPDDVHHFVTASGRVAAGFFVLALIGAGLRYGAGGMWLAFLASQTVHFAFVVWFVTETGGVNLFPGGRSLQDVGGWPTIFAIFALFYTLAAARLIGAHAAANDLARLADGIGTGAIGLFFLATYIPLIARSSVFAAPVVAILAALGFFLMRSLRAGA
ncbi:MAG: hypothetical protein ACREH4_05255 [Vitreimonas sp.]